MIIKVLERIESIRTRNQVNIKARNKDFHKLICNRDLLTLVSKSKHKPSYRSNGKLEKSSSAFIEELSFSLRNQSFNFTIKENSATKNIINTIALKENFQKNILLKDVLVLLLEAVYEPIFSVYNNSFQTKYCCHVALKEVKTQWTNINWILEGGIDSTYADLNQKRLITIIRKKIQDEKFIQLIWKFLRIPIKIKGTLYTPRKGIYSENTLSLLLIKIYTNELDIFLEELCFKSTKQNPKGRFYNTARINYKTCNLGESNSRRRQAVSQFSKNSGREIKESKISNNLLSFVPKMNLTYRKVRFIRYEQTWKLGIEGSKILCQNLKKIIEIFLTASFKSMISFKEVKMTYFPKETIDFLGYLLEAKKIVFLSKGSKPNRKRTGTKIILYLPIKSIVKKLIKKNFCTTSGRGKTKKGWIIYPDEIILTKYKNLLTKLKNYYILGKNYQPSLHRISHILKFSCAHTLAGKRRSSLSNQIKRLKTLTLNLREDKETNNNRARTGPQTMENIFRSTTKKTNLVLYPPCFLCNGTENLETYSMKLASKRIKRIQPEIEKIIVLLNALNKKQSCICINCQGNI